ncbi:helix-turn-helix transcriptional regulator [Micromonospora sp. WMMD882]|uniref:helix-turn-helix domain-containing protein n=1 Tax=Micromonospora sp. WMMD882 TaxID=3015151 RepID=UPI00248B9386|nr:helix-turn-helix transcriptional regulator [Micromonospora sp. WMMD882]WBB81073.1 helix-turn-helix transcriptional regulator [Micromonospora sp. WMMD882]
MPEDIGSTVPRRQLGRLLRQFRTEAGVTLDAAAEALEYSRQKIWRIESGTGAVRVLDVKAMCELYGVAAETTDSMRALALQTRAKGWWHGYGDVLPAWFELYVGLESAAADLRRHDESVIPDLFQTREYAQWLIRLDQPRAGEPDRDRAVAFRLRRQAVLTRRTPAAPRVRQIVSEAALRRTVGGPSLMIAQLQRLTDTDDLPNVSVRVIPLAAGPPPGAAAGSFVILDFPGGRDGRAAPEPSMVYRECLTGALYLDKPEEVTAYEDAWRGLDRLALDEGDSVDLIKQVIGELRHD